MNLLLIAVLLFVSGCAGQSLKAHTVALSDGDARVYKVLELYDMNAIGPSFSYSKLFECNAAGEQCAEVAQAPVVSAGIVSGLVLPAAMLGSAALVGPYGLAKSGPRVNQSGGGANASSDASATGGASSSKSSSFSNSGIGHK